VPGFTPSSAQSTGNTLEPNKDTKSVEVSCEIFGSLFCRPVENEYDSQLATVKVSEVYNVTSQQAEYINGFQADGNNDDKHKGIRLHSYNEDYISVDDVAGLNNTVFSVSFWSKKDPNAFNYGQVVSYVDRHGTEGWFFDTGQPEVQTARFVLTNSNGTAFISSDITIPDDKWINIVGTFDGDYQRVYVDGVLLSQKKFEGTYKAPTADIPLKIGNAAYCYSCSPWGGALDDLTVFDKALSAAEVKSIYDSHDASLDNLTRNTLGRWSFDGNVNDSSPYHRTTQFFTPTAGMVFTPDGRLFFTEKNTGNIRIMDKDDKVVDKPFATVPNLTVSIMYGLLGITIDPDFEQNHYVYAIYSSPKKSDPLQTITRVVRYTDNENEGTDMKVILDNLPSYNAFHTGGALAFGPDGKLYVTVGDGDEAPFATDPNILLGKVLRINKDGSIPTDNPDPSSPVYSLGHRNMFGIAFDPEKKNSKGEPIGMVTENGDRLYDEINILHKGGNYGWPLLQKPNQDPYLANNSSIKPARSYFLPIAPTQMIYYTGDKFPELKGMFVIGSYNSPRIFALKLDDSGQSVIHELDLLPDFGTRSMMAIAQSPTGDIYIGGHAIFKLTSIGPDRSQIVFPVQLNMSSPTAKFQGLSLIKNTMVLDIDPAGSTLSDITLKIPKNLIDGIRSIVATGTASGAQPELDYTVSDSPTSDEDSIVSIDTGQVGPSNQRQHLTITFTALRVTPIE
jgi:glucose/arabinose dehydrogenase